MVALMSSKELTGDEASSSTDAAEPNVASAGAANVTSAEAVNVASAGAANAASAGAANAASSEAPGAVFSTAAQQNKSAKVDLLILVCLLAIQAFCFLPMALNSGFYLDDWLTFWNLHFAVHNLPDLLKASFSDPRMVTRPIQCIYYACTYFFFGDKPLPYHLLRFGLEFAGAAFLYFGLKKITRTVLLPALAVAFFIVYPNHDSTHYWIGAGLGPGFGLTLYLASFYFLMDFASSKKIGTYSLSLIFFALSAFCYESFLPMLAMSFCGLMLSPEFCFGQSIKKKILRAGLLTLPFFAIGACEPIYQRFILPRFAKIFLSPSAFDPQYFVNVFIQAMNVSFGPAFWQFTFDRARDAFISLKAVSVAQIVGSALVSAALVIKLLCASKQESLSMTCTTSLSTGSNQSSPSTGSNQSSPITGSNQSSGTAPTNFAGLLISSALIFFCSYITFAVAQGYTPVLNTIINRVNIGGSVAVSIAIATIIAFFVQSAHSKKARMTVAISLTLPLLLLFICANIGQGAFWVVSWEVQKNVRFLIQQNAAKILPGQSILLAGVHRYLMWAPVFDGTWDFQSMLRMTLGTNNVHGGVVCDRLVINGENIIDMSGGYLCATYPTSRTTVLFPSQPEWLPIGSSKNFVDLIESKQKELSLDKTTLERWRSELAKLPVQMHP